MFPKWASIRHRLRSEIPLRFVRYLGHSSVSQSPMSKVFLRLMPLGGSITYGQGSSGSSGYRNRLYQLITLNGYSVDMVGSRKAGSMEHDKNEGWRGYRMEQILNKARKSVPTYMPNIFTVNAGSNDCVQDFEVESAGERLEALLEYLWASSPQSTVILSILLISADKETELRILRVNEQFRRLSERLLDTQKRIVLVDMHGADGPQLSELCDGTHPADSGYDKMAGIWFRGIEAAVARGFVQPPTSLSQNTTS